MKIAVIATVWFPFSHADVMISRWLKAYPGDDAQGWYVGNSDIASVFIEQTPANDIGHTICQEYNVPIYASIHEALTTGTNGLAVDAVLLIGEHGDYPMNEFHQKLYPRKRLLDEIGNVFRKCGRSVPVFNDKHLSWSFAEAQEMLALADELKFPLYAGSGLPHCQLESVGTFNRGEKIHEALCLFFGHEEHYGYHSIELLQSFIEHRPGGETGIKKIRALSGTQVRETLERGEISADLLRSALALEGHPLRDDLISFILSRTDDLLAFQFEHLDGLKVTHLRLQKWIDNWAVSLRTDQKDIFSAHPKTGTAQNFYNNFAALNTSVERFFMIGETPNSIGRTHLAGGVLEACLHAWKKGPEWQQTPHLHLSY